MPVLALVPSWSVFPSGRFFPLLWRYTLFSADQDIPSFLSNELRSAICRSSPFYFIQFDVQALLDVTVLQPRFALKRDNQEMLQGFANLLIMSLLLCGSAAFAIFGCRIRSSHCSIRLLLVEDAHCFLLRLHFFITKVPVIFSKELSCGSSAFNFHAGVMFEPILPITRGIRFLPAILTRIRPGSYGRFTRFQKEQDIRLTKPASNS